MKLKFKHYAYALLAVSASAFFGCKGNDNKDNPPAPPAVDIALEGSSDASNANVVVKEDVISDITETGAKVTGNIVKLAAGITATEYGHVYAKGSSAPTVTSGTKVVASGAIKTGSFSSNLSGLDSDTDYSVRMFYTTAKGTFYSPKTVSFKTNKPSATSAPTVTTGDASEVGEKGFKIAGRITAGLNITQHGHVWSKTNRNPTVNDSKTSLGPGATGRDFASTLTGLEENTTYYVRAYAQNDAGVGYGRVVQVKTAQSLTFFPELTLYFEKVSNDSTAVKYAGELFLSFVRVTGWNRAGGIVNVNDPTKQADMVEVRFGPGLKQKAHRFTVNKQGAGVPADGYRYRDYVDVAFQAWDATANKQLMVSFRDQQEDGQFTLIPINTEGDGSTHSREYVFIHYIDYAETASSEVAKNGGHEVKQMIAFWPFLREG
jgi:hypothetical protein